MIEIDSKYSEYKMMEMVLKSAIKDYIGCSANTKEFISAQVWIYDNEQTGYPSFKQACKILNIDVFKLRYELQKLIDNKQKRIFHHIFILSFI